MKKTLVFIILALFCINANSQQRVNHNHRLRENVTVDIHGDLQYENNQGLKASLSQNIFGDKIYKDNRGNEVTYAANILDEMYSDEDDYEILYSSVDAMYRSNNIKEKYKRDIHDALQYERNNFRASLSKSIFDEGVYKDSDNNEIKYSKEYWADIANDFDNNEIRIFFWLVNECRGLQNYKEEYKIDIFGYQQYKNNRNESASLSTDIFGKKVYKDSNGNKIEYSDQAWSLLQRRYGTEKDIFPYLIQKYLRGSGENGNDANPVQIITGTGDISEFIDDDIVDVKTDPFGTTITDRGGNKTTVKTDAFGTTIEDHKGNKTTIKEDAFGTTIEDNKGNRSNIRKDILGTWQYSNNNDQRAELRTDIFKTRIYTDSKNNKIEISEQSWLKMLDQSKDEKQLFIDMVNKYLLR